jgi:EcsC family protein
MPRPPRNSWLLRRAEDALRRGFERAYESVRVDPQHYLFHLQAAHRVPVSSFQGMFSLPVEQLDALAAGTIRAGMKIAALEGAGLGLGGLLTLVPDLGILSVVTLRTVQKLSLIYGFEYNTDEEVAELWIAAASAAGVDIGRELVEREVVNKFVPRVIERIAARASVEVVEKWTARVIPLFSSVLGAGLNYYFVRAWGERAAKHFRARHLQRREQTALPAATPLTLPASQGRPGISD